MALTPARQLAANTLLGGNKPASSINSGVKAPTARPVAPVNRPTFTPIPRPNSGPMGARYMSAMGQGKMVNGQVARQTVNPKRTVKVKPPIASGVKRFDQWR
jgi:hypothetical protein